jgi:acyl carrier protein phosphodiesterase
MNFLAHFYLSFDDEDLVLGNFLGDFLKNKDLPALPQAVQEGIRLHRMIDTFADSHPVVRRSTKRLHATQGKYAPVAVDVFYDYLLSRNWSSYSDKPLQTFANGIYQILASRMADVPQYLKKRTESMVAHNWLLQYATIEGLDFVFKKMDERTRFPSRFSTATDDLMKNAAHFDRDFNTFFPDIIAHTRQSAFFAHE